MAEADENMTLEEGMGYLLSQTPEPVQQFVLNDLSNTVIDLVRKYNLHVDHAGILERELLLMLVGKETPTEFVNTLTEVGVDRAAIDGLVHDVNENIFKPLRQEEQAPKPAVQEPSRPATPFTPPPAVQMAPAPAPIAPPVAPTPVAMPAPAPLPRPAAAPLPRPAPQSAYQPAPAPMPAKPEAFVSDNLPGAPAAPAPAPTIPRPSSPPQPNAARQELHDVLKSYGVDPYRETPE